MLKLNLKIEHIVNKFNYLSLLLNKRLLEFFCVQKINKNKVRELLQQHKGFDFVVV